MNRAKTGALGGVICALVMSTVGARGLLYQGFDISAQTPPLAGCNTGDFAGGAGSYPFPSDWLLSDVDMRTPDAQVAYINDAWEVREDFKFDLSQCAAFSTSWYSPPGQADDWTWTPAIAVPTAGAVLRWRAVAYDPAYPDGYEVRVMTSPDAPTGGQGVIGNQVTNSTVVFSVAHEAASWTSHMVTLDSYAGQTIFIGFRNTSNDQFILVIDDVEVIDGAPDLVAQAGDTPYAGELARAPDGFAVEAVLGLNAFNGGGSPLNNVVATATFMRDGVPVGLAWVSTPIPTLLLGETAPVAYGGASQLQGNGNWSLEYRLYADESGDEPDTANNVLEVRGPRIGGNELTRVEGPPIDVLGIGSGDGGELGTVFTLLNDATVAGVRFGMTIAPVVDDGTGTDTTIPNPFIGEPLVANVRAFNGGVPGEVLQTTVAAVADAAVGTYDVAFENGPQLLPAGAYLVTVVEPEGGPAMPLNTHADRYTPGSNWAYWPTIPSGDWTTLDTFGSSFAKVLEISLLTELSLFRDGFDAAAPVHMAGVMATRPAQALAPSRPTREPPPTQLVPGA